MKLGDLYSSTHDAVKAIERYQTAHDIFGKLGDKTGEARCLLTKGKLCSEIGQDQQALETLQQAAKIAFEASNSLIQMKVLYYLLPATYV